jgi:hypothetical protein
MVSLPAAAHPEIDVRLMDVRGAVAYLVTVPANDRPNLGQSPPQG